MTSAARIGRFALRSEALVGFEGHKDRKGSKVHTAVDALGHHLVIRVNITNEQDREHVERLASSLLDAVD